MFVVITRVKCKTLPSTLNRSSYILGELDNGSTSSNLFIDIATRNSSPVRHRAITGKLTYTVLESAYDSSQGHYAYKVACFIARQFNHLSDLTHEDSELQFPCNRTEPNFLRRD